MIRPHGLVEMVRTGEIAIARGHDVTSPPRGARAGHSEGAADAGQRHRRLAEVGSIPARRSSPRGWRATAGSAGSSPTAASPWPGWGWRARRPRAGARRFAEVARTAGETGRDAVLDEPRGLPAGAGPVWLGGFAFDPEGGGSATWSSFEPGSLFLPEVSICRRGEECFLTVNAIVGPGDDAERRGAELGRAARRPARRRDPAAARPAPDRPARDQQRPPAARLRRRGREGDSADRGGGDGEGRARPRGDRQRPPPPTTRRRSSARCASSSRPASASARGTPGGAPSSGPARSSWCGARGRASRPSPSPARPGAAPTRPSTTTSASA